MLELGDDAEKEHRAIGKQSASLSLEEVHLIGPLMKAAAEENLKANYWATKSEFETFLQKKSYKDTRILIKGSRGISLESVLELL